MTSATDAPTRFRWDRLTYASALGYCVLVSGLSVGVVLGELRAQFHINGVIAAMHGSTFGVGLLVSGVWGVGVVDRIGRRTAQRLRDAGDEKAQGGANLFHEGMERFAGLYDRALVSLLDHLPEDVIVLLDDPDGLQARVEDLDEGIARAFAAAREEYPLISPPEQLYLSVQAKGWGRNGTHALMLALAEMSGIDWKAR